jgi:hypothetical protein
MKWFKKKGQTRRSNIISIKNLKGNTDTNRRIATCLERMTFLIYPNHFWSDMSLVEINRCKAKEQSEDNLTYIIKLKIRAFAIVQRLFFHKNT